MNGREGDDCRLVPFIDFANHSFTPQLRWHIEKSVIQLRVTEYGASTEIAQGEELNISYVSRTWMLPTALVLV
jgi:hypothetical protein